MAEEHEYNHTHAHTDSRVDDSAQQLDVGYSYLAGALRVSFVVLKIIMVVLVILFLGSGVRTVGPGERAIVLTFGKISGAGESRLLGPGLKLLLPYPIHEIVRIPVEKKINLSLNYFWYFQRPEEIMSDAANQKSYIQPTLNPLIDGYCLVRGEKQNQTGPAIDGSDYNILHCKWELTYQIADPERFFKNNFVDIAGLQAGQNYADVIEKSINPLLENLFADAVVTTMVNYTIEEAMFEKVAAVTEHVTDRLQKKLAAIDSGVKVVSVQLRDITWPRQVSDSFQAALTATQAKQQAISEAKLYAEKTLNETAGTVAVDLLAALHDNNGDPQKQEQLWIQVAGKAQEKIADAKGYRTQVVEAARANAEYLEKILPEYRKHPKLVVQRIYQDAIEQVLRNADEKMVIQPTQNGKGTEVRVLINRDAAIKPKSEPGKQK
jgi:membrane protease subunit HflK